jgi:tRNA(His) 5'-end guanylyltransferase
VAEATNQLEKLTVAEKNELLFNLNINYNNVPAWQKRGIGFYWEKVNKKGFNPVSKKETTVERRELIQEQELPLQNYKDWLLARIT